jgi:hypothetical protein
MTVSCPDHSNHLTLTHIKRLLNPVFNKTFS